jgi:hypothetical protein
VVPFHKRCARYLSFGNILYSRRHLALTYTETGFVVSEEICLNDALNGGAIIDHEAPRERRFVPVKEYKHHTQI